MLKNSKKRRPRCFRSVMSFRCAKMLTSCQHICVSCVSNAPWLCLSIHVDTSFVNSVQCEVRSTCVRSAVVLFVSTGKCFWGKQVSEGHRRAPPSTEGPNILGCLLPKRHGVSLVQLKETGVILLTKNIRLFAVGILQTRWKFLRQKRLE